MAKEKQLLNDIQLSVSKARSCVLFRNNTGTGWTGTVVKHTPTEMILHMPRPIHAGLCKGSSDLIGWTMVEVTLDMVGRTVAIFTAIEAKTGRVKMTVPQKHFVDTIKTAGGIAGEIREVEQVAGIIEAFKAGSR